MPLFSSLLAMRWSCTSIGRSCGGDGRGAAEGVASLPAREFGVSPASASASALRRACRARSTIVWKKSQAVASAFCRCSGEPRSWARARALTKCFEMIGSGWQRVCKRISPASALMLYSRPRMRSWFARSGPMNLKSPTCSKISTTWVSRSYRNPITFGRPFCSHVSEILACIWGFKRPVCSCVLTYTQIMSLRLYSSSQ
ncbi:hypothetical protein GGS23DRAFT_591643 [Durotheca rogersii]|uniref:uncharacterized protein n=1 Tax=Durotheca rogersii TaxID=419775 RepID=UPI00221FDE0E|nr:uncharacterized protein GGS23DRAFT_591643 [Durotheca rogersii]KAI5849919.1 hypothetical protein GGS23DRAFT_591643 [Durotheca rogersii]